jgi:hypothetical protein
MWGDSFWNEDRVPFALPTTIIAGAITGTAGAQSDVGTGELH